MIRIMLKFLGYLRCWGCASTTWNLSVQPESIGYVTSYDTVHRCFLYACWIPPAAIQTWPFTVLRTHSDSQWNCKSSSMCRKRDASNGGGLGHVRAQQEPKHHVEGPGRSARCLWPKRKSRRGRSLGAEVLKTGGEGGFEASPASPSPPPKRMRRGLRDQRLQDPGQDQGNHQRLGARPRPQVLEGPREVPTWEVQWH